MTKTQKTKVIVTGGAGFIGSHVQDALVEKGYDVHVVDNFSTGKKENIHPAATLHEMDIRDFKKIAPLFNGARFVFHLAAFPRVEPSIQDPITSHDMNLNGTLNVLQAAKDAKVEKVIYSASSAVYGNPDSFPTSENAPVNPMSPYGLQKYVGELYCRLFSFLYGIQTVSLRYFNVYGRRQSEEGAYALVIGRFLKEKRGGRPLPIVPDGNQSRDFVHVRDVVRANLLAMESDRVGKGEVINIGSGKNYSVNEIASFIGGPTVFVEPRVEPKKTLADISRAKELLGWEPSVRFEDGIAELKKLSEI
ncbi:MAG: NAD-dependent epimerase/dehydratase family protein [bacterium]|nr:NAD-dependent epimerase/dehydratase family protein [bacterium]